MTILHVLYSNRFSGAENVVCQIIDMFKGDPDVRMVYCSPDGQIREALSERGVEFEPIAELSKKELRRVIKKVKPDVIHAHDMRASFIAALTCRNLPFISHVHNNFVDARGLSPKSVAYLCAALKAKHIFWVSESAMNEYAFKNTVADKSEVLYNIISIDALYRKMQSDENEYSYDVAYVGRLTEQKNPQRLISVIAKLRDLKSDVKVAVVGSGDLEDEARALCREHSLENNIDFLGFQSNPLKILHSARAMVMVSRWEGTPMCALEAMGLGVPIVSTPVDGLKVLIDQGENGYLSDNDDELAKRLCEIIENDEIHARMSAYTLKKAKEINAVEPYKERLLAQYK